MKSKLCLKFLKEKNKMKILIILIRWKGGVGRVITNQKRILEKLGHEVEVISREDDLKYFSTKEFFFKIRKEVKSRKYDILYSQDWSCALPLMFFKNHCICFHGNETKNKFFQNVVGRLKGKRLIVVGDLLKEKFPKSTLAYNGVDLDDFKDLKMTREKGNVGFANWHNSSYNYEEIKSAVEKVGMKLIDTNLKLTKKELVEFYNKIEIFISLPKEFAGFNITWVEAMACNVPKIIGNNNGIGRIIDINHIEDFKGIEDVLRNAKSKKDYKINPAFNWNVQTNKVLNVFNKFLGVGK